MPAFETVILMMKKAANRFPFFAGKDILYTMEPELTSMGFISPLGFRNKVISGIEKAANAWTWLPEWGRLRQEVMKARFP